MLGGAPRWALQWTPMNQGRVGLVEPAGRAQGPQWRGGGEVVASCCCRGVSVLRCDDVVVEATICSRFHSDTATFESEPTNVNLQKLLCELE